MKGLFYMQILKDEEFLIEEPCVDCEAIYVEDIWNEFCCDLKECIHKESYEKKKKELEMTMRG